MYLQDSSHPVPRAQPWQIAMCIAVALMILFAETIADFMLGGIR